MRLPIDERELIGANKTLRLLRRYAQFLQLGFGALFLICAGIALHHHAQFADARILLAQTDQRQSPLQVRWRELEALRIVVDHFAVRVDRLIELLLRKENFA